MGIGIPEGPEIGIRLRDAEEWWIERDFAPRRDELLQWLRDAVRKPHG